LAFFGIVYWLAEAPLLSSLGGEPAELDQARLLGCQLQAELRKSVAKLVRGHLAYYAVPGNGKAVNAFRFQAIRHWHRALRRRSQRSSLNWKRMSRLAQRSLPPVRIINPWPDARFHARIQARSSVS
jgi:RNA-directed DNA polymerase